MDAADADSLVGTTNVVSPIPHKTPSPGHFSSLDEKLTFVILFCSPPKEAAGVEKLESLIRRLDQVGLEVECRYGGKRSVLVFVRCPGDKLNALVVKARSTELFHGVRSLVAHNQMRVSLSDEPVTPAESLRVVYTMIASPADDGGAGITPGLDPWECVEFITPLGDSGFNKEWIQTWSLKWWITDSDFTRLRNHYGEKVTLYFAFTQFYCISLIPISAVGIFSHIFLPAYHPFYAVALGAWTIGFKHAWERRQRDLAIRWGVKGFTKLVEQRRAAHVTEGDRLDPITGVKVGHFPTWKSIARRMIFVPFGAASALALLAVLTLIFAVEVYVSEVYVGPFKEFLVFTPTMLLSILFPVLSNTYSNISKALTIYENHRTERGFENAMTQKTFILSFLTGYLSIFLTAYVYVPFGNHIVPNLDFSIVGHDSRASFAVDPSRLKQQVIYFGVLGQILQAAEEYFFPYVTRKLFSEARRITHTGDYGAEEFDVEEQKLFLNKVRQEIELPEYEIYEDYDEMVIQFGFISLWSIVWPIIPLACFINNWIEVRSDAAKICTSRRRPIPHRADSIGPWLDNLSFIAWLGTLTNCTLIYLFGADDAVFQFDYSSIICLLVIVLIAEHIYWIVDYVVGSASKQYKTDGEVIVTKEDYVLRQRQLRDSSGDNHSGTEGRDDNSYRARGFWKGKGVEESVRDGFDLLSKRGHRSRST